MNLNPSSLSHPRIQWEIEAAMWRAIEISNKAGIGVGCVRNAAGEVLITAVHDRQAIPAFSFRCGPVDVTERVLGVIRSSTR